MQIKELKIEGMTCQHCVMAVKKALESVKGVLAAEVSLNDNSATVTIDENQFDLEEARKAVQAAGHYKIIS